MKKCTIKKKKMQFVLIFLLTLVFVSGCGISKEEYNNKIKTWNNEYLVKPQQYNFTMVIETFYSDDPEKKPERIPDSISTVFRVIVSKENNTISVQKEKIITNMNSSADEEKTETVDKKLKLSILEDGLLLEDFQNPEKTIKIRENQSQNQLLKRLLQYEENDLMDGSIVTYGVSEDDVKTLSMQKSVDSESLKKITAIFTQENTLTWKDNFDINYIYNTDKDRMISTEFYHVEPLIDMIFEKFGSQNPKEIYENINLKNDQILIVYFND